VALDHLLFVFPATKFFFFFAPFPPFNPPLFPPDPDKMIYYKAESTFSVLHEPTILFSFLLTLLLELMVISVYLLKGFPSSVALSCISPWFQIFLLPPIFVSSSLSTIRFFSLVSAFGILGFSPSRNSSPSCAGSRPVHPHSLRIPLFPVLAFYFEVHFLSPFLGLLRRLTTSPVHY